MQGKGWNSQAFSRYKFEVKKGYSNGKGCTYNFKDVWDDAIRMNAAVILEEASLGRSEGLEI
jgi:hypothetical protein